MALSLSLFNLSELKATFHRFPTSVLFSILTFLFVTNEINDVVPISDEWSWRSIFFLVLGFFWAGCVQIFSESHILSYNKRILALITGLAVYAAFSFAPPNFYSHNIILILCHLASVNVILLLIAPYIGRSSDNDSLWEYNRQFCFGVCLAFVTACVFWAGFSGALASIGYLFDIDIDGDVYMTLWSFAAIVLAPIYALSLVPKQFIFMREECDIKNALQFIVKWVLLPLVFVYFIILYAYFLKIAVLWEIPKGQLSWMIMGFAGAGIITFLTAWPYEVEGHKIFRIFRKTFFPLLILPSIMLCMAVYLRIDQYGVTEQRFYLALVGLYLVILSTYMSVCHHNLKAVFGIAISLILLSSTPLLNAKKMAEWSQIKRLEILLMNNGLIQGDTIIPATKAEDISAQDRYEITETYKYIARLKREQKQKTFMGHDVNHAHGDRFENVFGFAPLHRYEFERQEKMSANNEFALNLRECDRAGCLINVRGYDIVTANSNMYLQDSGTKTKPQPQALLDTQEVGAFDVRLQDNQLIFEWDDDVVRLDLNADLKNLLKNGVASPNKLAAVVIEGQGTDHKVRAIVHYIKGRYEGEKPMIQSLNMKFMVGQND